MSRSVILWFPLYARPPPVAGSCLQLSAPPLPRLRGGAFSSVGPARSAQGLCILPGWGSTPHGSTFRRSRLYLMFIGG